MTSLSSSSSATTTNTDTTSSLFSQTFVEPTPSASATPNPGPGVGGNPGSTNGGNWAGPPAGTSASLYLYTFLATLILLLAISGAIVARSILLRRRHRAMIAAAIANGTWVPPPPGGGRRRGGGHNDIGEKPVVWEASAWNSAGKGKGEGEDWDEILPFAATYVNQQTTTPATTTTPTMPQPAVHPSRFRRALAVIVPPRNTPPPAPVLPVSTADLTPAAATETPSAPSTIRVAVLIAMPSPPVPAASTVSSDDEKEIPHVEFGVVDLVVGGEASGREQREAKRLSDASGSGVANV